MKTKKVEPVVIKTSSAIAALFFPFVACQSKLVYFPRAYEDGLGNRWQTETSGKFIDYLTPQGQQRAFLQGCYHDPRRMWVVCGGNGTLALEWSRFFTDNGHTNDAYLLVDFPGYGHCEGRPTPKSIRENLKHAISAACSEAGWEEIQTDRLRVFGHSLGAAAVLMAAEDFQIRKGVLLAPFTSSMDMAKVYTGLPLGFLVTERFDNRARIGAVSKFGPGRLVIVHGTEDESIPVRMGRELARLYPDNVIFREVAQGKHNNIQQDFPEEIIKAISESAE